MRIFDSLNDFESRMVTVENGLNRNLDEMYFMHAGIFSLRSRPLEVSAAKNILACESYDALPSSIFSCGATISPRVFLITNNESLCSNPNRLMYVYNI